MPLEAAAFEQEMGYNFNVGKQINEYLKDRTFVLRQTVMLLMQF